MQIIYRKIFTNLPFLTSEKKFNINKKKINWIILKYYYKNIIPNHLNK